MGGALVAHSSIGGGQRGGANDDEGELSAESSSIMARRCFCCGICASGPGLRVSSRPTASPPPCSQPHWPLSCGAFSEMHPHARADLGCDTSSQHRPASGGCGHKSFSRGNGSARARCDANLVAGVARGLRAGAERRRALAAIPSLVRRPRSAAAMRRAEQPRRRCRPVAAAQHYERAAPLICAGVSGGGSADAIGCAPTAPTSLELLASAHSGAQAPGAASRLHGGDDGPAPPAAASRSGGCARLHGSRHAH